MDTAPSPMKKDFGFLYFLMARLVGMLLVAVALPAAHSIFGVSHLGDGQQEFGFVILFMIVGGGAAFVYLITATFAHFLVRKKSLRTKLLVEAGVFFVFLIALVYGGITAHFS
jgi:hypothetical protein